MNTHKAEGLVQRNAELEKELAAKNRELQIEAALDRVRTRAMAMQRSDELKDLIATVSVELFQLDFELNRSSIIIFDPQTKGMTWWMAHPETPTEPVGLFVQYHEHPSFLALVSAWKERALQWQYLLEGEVKRKWDEFLFTETELSQLPEFVIANMRAETKVYLSASFNKFGGLSIATLEPLSPTQFDVLVRFANVFDLTYTRFNDLKLAEAQRREAQIEAALERVRSVALSMKKPDDLLTVCEVVYKELYQLGFDELRNAMINIYNDAEEELLNHDYSVDSGAKLNRVPYHSHPIVTKYIDEAKQADDAFTQLTIEGEELEDWKKFREMHGEQTGPKLRTTTALYYYHYSFEAGVLSISNFKPINAAQLSILKRFRNVFNLSYQRYIDITTAEAQAREARIEAALERVRARTMAMQKSEELAAVAELLFQQLSELGIKTWTTGFNIWSDDNNFYTDYITNPQGGFMEPYTIDTQVFHIFSAISDAKKRGDGFYVNYEEGEALAETYRQLAKFGEKQFNGILESGFQFPSCQYEHFVFGAQVSLMFITYEPVPEAHEIFKRFGNVFEQTYTRFLDLQKAEAQAREAQIEAALEKVRSRSLGMHKSTELKEVITVVLQKLQQLGVAMEGRSAVIAVFEEGVKDFHQYVASPEHTSAIEQYTPYYDSPVLNDLWNARANGENFYIKSYTAKEKNELFNFYFENTGLRHLPEEEKKWLLEQEHYEVYVALEKHSAVIIANLTSSPLAAEDHQVFQRFARVFEQAYIRFFDLQRAEAQARESQVEAALEKIRSRSLAMQRSDELKDVIVIVFEKLQELGLVFQNAGIQLFTQGSKDIVQWVASQDFLSAPVLVNLPYIDKMYEESEIVRDIWMAKEKGENIYNKSYSFEEKNKFFGYAAAYNNLEQLPESAREAQRQASGYTQTLVAEMHSALWVDSYSGQTISDEGFAVVTRTAKVFEQAYTRFLDLQRVEAHAKEAKIEAAMERLRSRAMAMQTSGELAVVVKTMYTELKRLDESLTRGFIMIFDAQTGGVTWWMAGDEVSSEQAYYIPHSEHPPQLAYLEGWQKQQEKWLYTMQGREKKDWDAFLFDKTELSNLPGAVIDYMKSYEKIHLSASFNSFGCLTTGSVQPLSEESFNILIRFSKVFDFSYTRFNDLKQAEAQAIRAAQDLVEIKAARKRAEDTLAALKATQAQLIQAEKMASLGELTAGIAHEIQNPLNFVNNFSAVNSELVSELRNEAEAGNLEEVISLANTIEQNEAKIGHHGKRADAIVKSMLQHSRGAAGERQRTNINALAEEYLQLAYHGYRAKDQSFQADLTTDYDPLLGEVEIVPQEMGRVLLNLFNNAFYAVHEKVRQRNDTFEPLISVCTKKAGNNFLITVKDNGTGMPQRVAEKVFQPFFTTKPTGEGTGLGLSLSYDIITKGHRGELRVDSKEGEGSEFIIKLPIMPT